MFNQNIDNNDLRRIALFALKSEQAEVFTRQPCFSYMMVNRVEYDSKLTSAKIDSNIAGWLKLGLFVHLSKAEVNKAIDNVQAADRLSIGG